MIPPDTLNSALLPATSPPPCATPASAASRPPRPTPCSGPGAVAAWDAFADSWNDLGLDRFMADGGRYRKRRFAAFSASPDGEVVRKPHQPHYQSRDYNGLNGGVQRWFEPVTEGDRRPSGDPRRPGHRPGPVPS